MLIVHHSLCGLGEGGLLETALPTSLWHCLHWVWLLYHLRRDLQYRPALFYKVFWAVCSTDTDKERRRRNVMSETLNRKSHLYKQCMEDFSHGLQKVGTDEPICRAGREGRHREHYPMKSRRPVGICYMTPRIQTGALWPPRGVGGRFKREGTYVHLWLIHTDVWQKGNQYCKAIILQLKIH